MACNPHSQLLKNPRSLGFRADECWVLLLFLLCYFRKIQWKESNIICFLVRVLFLWRETVTKTTFIKDKIWLGVNLLFIPLSSLWEAWQYSGKGVILFYALLLEQSWRADAAMAHHRLPLRTVRHQSLISVAFLIVWGSVGWKAGCKNQTW